METTINLHERISEFAVKKEKEASNQEEYYKKNKRNNVKSVKWMIEIV